MSELSCLPSTPVLIGVGQYSERLGEVGYEALSPVDLAARAARAAIKDADVVEPAHLAELLDTIAATRQFDESTPVTSASLGGSDNIPRSVARRIGADPVRAIYDVTGGQSPMRLVTEVAQEIASGRSRAALVVGAEAISTVLDLVSRESADRPDFTEYVEGQLDDRGYGLGQGMVSRTQVTHGLTDAAAQYAMFENARRARNGWTRAEQAAWMGELFAPFTRVAADNPHAAAPTARSADDLVAVTEENRIVVDPYPRSVMAREKVNQAAAVIVMSQEAAEEIGVPRERWVYLAGHADVRERALLERADLGAAPASVLAVEAALEMSDIVLDDVAHLDLYSCFPIAVGVMLDGLGLQPDDPRGLSCTGGLPFFGGPGNNYSLHAVAEVVDRVRTAPGSFGLVGANGGMLSKYSVGVFTTTPTPWRRGSSERLQAVVDGWPAVPIAAHVDGWASVETWTVRLSRSGRRSAILIGRLDDGRRFFALPADGDDELVDVLMGEDGPGARIYVRTRAGINHATLTEQRMDELLPPRETAFRDTYEFVELRREGHLLEITINRPEARNALTPEANQELADVVDAYLADRDLWVAILTGAGDRAFCAGNDLAYTASGKPMWVPESGFAGLTSRRELHKPVIAAVNGHAMGGGFEIALAATLVVADERAEFALPEVKVGLVAAAGGVVRLPRALPPHVAQEMVLTGRRMSAEEAARWGVVNRVAPAGGALEAARELAARIMEVSPTSVRLSMQMMENARQVADPVAAIEVAEAALDELLVARDTLEGVMAFVSKRQPVWRNQ